MWRPDRTVTGPHRIEVREIDALNRVFSDAFTDRYRKDGLVGVRVPYLNPAIWRYAIADAGDGAFVWRDARGDLVAFNIVHRSGSEGWMGPLGVRPDRQGDGLGRRIVLEGIEWLRAQGATTIGLETMPRTIDNIGFYSRLGFTPGPLTITLQRDEPRRIGGPAQRLSFLDGDARSRGIAGCRARSCEIAGDVDFTREIELTLENRLGDVTLLAGDDGAVRAFALWHTAALAQGRSTDELRVLKLVAPDLATAMVLLAAVEREAAGLALRHVSLRCQGRYAGLYAALIAEGYRVQWTDLRMTLIEHPEPTPRGIVLSNWEI